MKKGLGIFLLVGMLVLGCVSFSKAEDNFRRFGVGINGGLAIPGDPYSNVTADCGAAGGINFSYLVSPHIGFELGVSRFETGWKNTSDIDMGNLSVTPITLVAKYRIRPEKVVNPYLGVGIVYFINSFDISDRYRQLNYGAELEVDDAFGFAASAGLEVKLAKDLSVDLDVKYVAAEAGARWKLGSTTEEREDADLGTTTIGLGVKYYF